VKTKSEIILYKPILKDLSMQEIASTLCHEIIHALIDMALMVHEIHGSNFSEKCIK